MGLALFHVRNRVFYILRGATMLVNNAALLKRRIHYKRILLSIGHTPSGFFMSFLAILFQFFLIRIFISYEMVKKIN